MTSAGMGIFLFDNVSAKLLIKSRKHTQNYRNDEDIRYQRVFLVVQRNIQLYL